MKAISLLCLLVSCAYIERVEKKPETFKSVALLRQEDYLDCVKNSETYKLNRTNQKRWRLIAEFSIAPGGKVIEPKITNSDFEETALHHCVVKQIAGLTISGDQDARVFRQMLDLNPGSIK